MPRRITIYGVVDRHDELATWDSAPTESLWSTRKAAMEHVRELRKSHPEDGPWRVKKFCILPEWVKYGAYSRA